MNTHTSRVLAIAVGGGSDAVSALLAIENLKANGMLHADEIDVLSVLPSVVDYVHVKQMSHHLCKILPETYRVINQKPITLIDAWVAKAGCQVVPELRHVFGISMAEGSKGVIDGLRFLQASQRYDRIIAMDVGGDFIAHKDNLAVLSPMMDGIMGYALCELEAELPLSYLVMGLGTDGESTTELLNKALTQVNAVAHTLDKATVQQFESYYRKHVEPIRYARTLDYLIAECVASDNVPHLNPSIFRARFVCKFSRNQPGVTHYGNFDHYIDPKFWGQFYTFESIQQVSNPFKISCTSELDWFLRSQSADIKYNNELNGQFIPLDQHGLTGENLFMATPSHLFSSHQRQDICHQVCTALQEKDLRMALFYRKDLEDYKSNADLYVVELCEQFSIATHISNAGLADAMYQIYQERFLRKILP